MSAWALDSSLALAWALPDEMSGQAQRFLEGLAARDRLWVPPLWWYEIANGLLMARRRGRISEAEAARFLGVLGRLPLETEPMSGVDVAERLSGLAWSHGLTAYDAAYLDLAQRRGLGLASLDEKLRKAAAAAGVDILRSA